MYGITGLPLFGFYRNSITGLVTDVVAQTNKKLCQSARQRRMNDAWFCQTCDKSQKAAGQLSVHMVSSTNGEAP
jgi:hypothetical protein